MTLATVSEPRVWPRTARGMNSAGPTPAATIGWAIRSSAEASARATALPVRSTSPVTDPDAGKVRSSELLGQEPVGGFDDQVVGSGGEGQGGQVGADQLPGVAHDEAEQLAGVGAGQDRGGDGPDGLQPPGAIPRFLVELGVLDGHPGLGGQQDQGPLVVGVEVLTAALLGQIQVAVHPSTGGDRGAEERPHRRVVGWEADRAGVVGEVVQPQRSGVVDQHPEDAAADRDVADRRPLGVADPGGDELGDDAVAAQRPQAPRSGRR